MVLKNNVLILAKWVRLWMGRGQRLSWNEICLERITVRIASSWTAKSVASVVPDSIMKAAQLVDVYEESRILDDAVYNLGFI